jgi:hypothetical protein
MRARCPIDFFNQLGAETMQIENTQTSQHTQTKTHARYARALAASKRARWEIDRDVLQGRALDPAAKFLPDGLSKVQTVPSLSEGERRLMSQVQGRTYANIFGLVERFINAKVLEISADHHFGDQTALEALVRFSDEELKHQELFRRVDRLCADVMQPGYTFAPEPNAVARVVLGKSTWAVLALTCLIELFTQAHYVESISPDEQLSPRFKDVFRFHWMEESQHAVLDELEWQKEDAKLDDAARVRAVTDLIELVGAVDGILQAQSALDVKYFIECVGRPVDPQEAVRIGEAFLRAYRYQYIASGVERTRFPAILKALIPATELERVLRALAPLL